MNLLIKIISPLFFLNIMNVPGQQECKGKLVVETDSRDAVISVNDKIYTGSGFESELDEGFYVIKARNNVKSWSKVFTDTVFLRDCSEKKLVYNFTDQIYFETTPHDVKIFSNDSLIGYTPLFISSSLNEINLTKEGYRSEKIILHDIKNAKPFQMDLINEEGKEEESFFKKDIFKILVGGIVVLGGTTAYFKLKADNKFDDYQRYGRQELLDETRRYDLISGITFTALQINFGALIYFFLID